MFESNETECLIEENKRLKNKNEDLERAKESCLAEIRRLRSIVREKEDAENNSEQYSLVGVDGNAFSLMSYTKKALMETGHADLIDKMLSEAMSGDYSNVIIVCESYLKIANEK